MLHLATNSDLPAIEALYQRAIADLNSRGLFQWNDKYPNRQTYERAIAAGTMFVYHEQVQVQVQDQDQDSRSSSKHLGRGEDQVQDSRSSSKHLGRREDQESSSSSKSLEREGQLLGAVILDENQAKEWEAIDWQLTGGRILVIHALVVDPGIQGKGLGKTLLGLCEQYAVENGYAIIRLDAFRENEAVLRFYEKAGYHRLGAVWFDYKPKGYEWYVCWEKAL